MHNFKSQKFKHFIDDIVIDIWYSWNFASMKDIIKTCNPNVGFSKFKSNKKIEEEFEDLEFNF